MHKGEQTFLIRMTCDTCQKTWMCYEYLAQGDMVTCPWCGIYDSVSVSTNSYPVESQEERSDTFNKIVDLLMIILKVLVRQYNDAEIRYVQKMLTRMKKA